MSQPRGKLVTDERTNEHQTSVNLLDFQAGPKKKNGMLLSFLTDLGSGGNQFNNRSSQCLKNCNPKSNVDGVFHVSFNAKTWGNKRNFQITVFTKKASNGQSGKDLIKRYCNKGDFRL